MATRQITTDDILGTDIQSSPIKGKVTISLTGDNLPEIPNFKVQKDGSHLYDSGDLDLGITSIALIGYILTGDLTSAFNAIKPFVSQARVSSDDGEIMRKWLKANGYPVNDRGRIPADYVATYRKATEAASPE